MRKQFKKIVSAVLSAAMVLSVASGVNLKSASAADEPAAGAETTTDEAGFTAMIGFQTNDYDCRDSYDDEYYSTGQKYLEWLKEQDPEVDLSNVQTCNGRNIYYNGNTAAANKKTLQLRQPEKVELNKDAVVTDAKMTADGEYTVSINNLNLNVNPDGKEEADGEIFNMLYIAADIPMSNATGVEVRASSVKIDGEEVASDVVLPQKSSHKKYGQFMVADAYDPDKYADGVAYGKEANALSKIPEQSIEITFSISGVDWNSPKYQPKEIDFSAPLETEDPNATTAPIPTTAPITKTKISQPFDIGVVSNVNIALTKEVADPEAENGKIQASVFGTAEYWNLLKTSIIDETTKKPSYGDHQQTFYESATGSVHITETGEYKLTVTALADSEDMAGDGAIWLPIVPNQMPKDFNLVGNTITVGDKTYAWGGKLYADGVDAAAGKAGSARLSVCNQWASDSQKDVANPVKSAIPVKTGDQITFTFSVTAEAPEQPKVTPVPTAPPAAKSYNAYLGFQTDNWLFRDPWNKSETGLKAKDYNYKSQIGLNYGGKTTGINAKIKDAKIVQGTTKYTISISGVNLKTLKGNDAKATAATKFNMLYITTDIPRSMKSVKCTDAVLKLDGKEIKKYKTVPYKGDVNDYYQLMLADAYAPADGTKNAEYPSGKELKILPTDSIEVSFSISGVNFDKTPVGPTKGKSFTKGNFKYKVTKNSVKSAKTKKTSTGTVTVVGLSKKGKKAKKLSVPASLTQKKGKFKVTALKAGALKSTKVSSVTLGKNIKKLPKNAFKGCKNLSKLTLKAKLSSVKKGAFKGCTKTIKIAGASKKSNLKKIKKVYKKAK